MKSQSTEVSRNIVWSELVGRENFGFLRLPLYLERVQSGGLKCPCIYTIDDTAPGVALFDAGGGFGQYAGRLAMEHAIALAQRNTAPARSGSATATFLAPAPISCISRPMPA